MKVLVAAVVVRGALGSEYDSAGAAAAVVAAEWAFVVVEQEVAQLLHHLWVGLSPFVEAGSVAADATQCLTGSFLMGTWN